MKDLIQIKGTKKGLVFIVATELAFNEAATVIKQKLDEANGFFRSANFNIQASHFNEQEIHKLEQICLEHGLIKNAGAQLPVLEHIYKAREEIAASVLAEEQPSDDTLLLMRNLRSGQTIKYPGNIVVVGDVNPGAEIISEGNIIVLGKLRGVAHAGVSGKNDSFILAYRLQPTQLRINNLVSRPPENENPVDYPEIARISPEGICIEKYIRNFKS